MIILLGSVALPLTNGFVGEFLLLIGVFEFSDVIAAVCGLTVILGAVYMGLPKNNAWRNFCRYQQLYRSYFQRKSSTRSNCHCGDSYWRVPKTTF